jgi:hypothetical protein
MVALMKSAAAEDSQTGQNGSKWLADHFVWDLRMLAFGILQQPADSTQNPSNDFLHIPRYTAAGEARPDLRLSLDRLELSTKPRMSLSYRVDDDSTDGRSRRQDDVRLNEWLVRMKLRENLFISYGCENLQWGPSFLFSPSNPYFRDNGRRNTYMEVPGMDFGRVVWLPGGPWAISFIANTGEGANKAVESDNAPASAPPLLFDKTYSIKADFTGREKYASFILSRRENSETMMGFYGGWTATDALLLFGEGTIARGNRALYPVENQSPLGASMEPLHARDSAFYPVLLAGAAYTFMSKSSLTVEYTYHSPGYDESVADRYYALRNKAASALESGGVISEPAQQTLGLAALTGLRFLRRNYAMIQYSQPDIANKISLTLRWIQSLNEQSGYATSILSYSPGKHIELFSVGIVAIGNRNTEFSSILGKYWQFGLQYTH